MGPSPTGWVHFRASMHGAWSITSTLGAMLLLLAACDVSGRKSVSIVDHWPHSRQPVSDAPIRASTAAHLAQSAGIPEFFNGALLLREPYPYLQFPLGNFFETYHLVRGDGSLQPAFEDEGPYGPDHMMYFVGMQWDETRSAFFVPLYEFGAGLGPLGCHQEVLSQRWTLTCKGANSNVASRTVSHAIVGGMSYVLFAPEDATTPGAPDVYSKLALLAVDLATCQASVLASIEVPAEYTYPGSYGYDFSAPIVSDGAIVMGYEANSKGGLGGSDWIGLGLISYPLLRLLPATFPTVVSPNILPDGTFTRRRALRQSASGEVWLLVWHVDSLDAELLAIDTNGAILDSTALGKGTERISDAVVTSDNKTLVIAQPPGAEGPSLYRLESDGGKTLITCLRSREVELVIP